MRLAATSLKGLVAANLFLTNLKCVRPAGTPGFFVQIKKCLTFAALMNA